MRALGGKKITRLYFFLFEVLDEGTEIVESGSFIGNFFWKEIRR